VVIISAGTRGAGLVAQNMPSHRRLPAAAITATVVAMLGLLAVAGASAAVGELFATPGAFLSGVVEGLAAGGLVLVAGTVACLAALRSVVRHGGGAAPGWGWAVLALVAGSTAATTLIGAGFATDQSVVIAGTVLTSPVAAAAAAWGVLELWAWRRRSA